MMQLPNFLKPGTNNHLFQGLWTDPVTGISYARNRWYDARTASWLSEDPMGAVDSPNLYAFVGWGPHMATDPMGLVRGADAHQRALKAIAEIQGTDVETMSIENAARTGRFLSEIPKGIDNPSMAFQEEFYELNDDPGGWFGGKWQSTKETAVGLWEFGKHPIEGTKAIVSLMVPGSYICIFCVEWRWRLNASIASCLP